MFSYAEILFVVQMTITCMSNTSTSWFKVVLPCVCFVFAKWRTQISFHSDGQSVINFWTNYGVPTVGPHALDMVVSNFKGLVALAPSSFNIANK